MLFRSEGDGRGPQLTVNNQTIYAKTKEHSPYLSDPGNRSIKQLNAMEFCSFIDKSGEGRQWTAVDITTDGVMHAGQERIPLSEYLSQDELAEFEYRQYDMHYNNMELSTKPPEIHEDPKKKKPPKPSEFDPLLYTTSGVELKFLEDQKIQFPKVFRDDLPDRTDGSDPRVHKESIHTINLLPNAQPSFRKAWRTSPAERAEIDKQVKYMLQKGLIKPSSSPWGAPTLFAPKSDGRSAWSFSRTGHTLSNSN